MQLQIFQCDLCHKEWDVSKCSWDQNANGATLKISPDGINGGFDIKNLCQQYRAIFYNNILSTIENIKKERLKCLPNQ